MKKDTILTVSFLGMLVLGMLILLGFSIYQIRGENEETSLLLSAIEKRAEEDALVQSIKSLQKSAEAEILTLEEATISEAELVSVIEKLEEAGRALSLNLEVVSVDKIEDDMPRVLLALESEGSWQKNFLLLSALEELPYKAVLSEATLSKEGSNWRTRATLTLYLYNGHE